MIRKILDLIVRILPDKTLELLDFLAGAELMSRHLERDEKNANREHHEVQDK